jgi:hypothetical protein
MVSALRQELEQLRSSSVVMKPSARLAAVRQRLAKAEVEGGATRLVAAVAAVEALARSLVVHAPQRSPATAHLRYQQVRATGALPLVEETLRIYGAPPPTEFFGGDAWDGFEVAQLFRDVIVHECTVPGHDRYPLLIQATERVLEGLVEAGGLLRVVS